MTEKKTSRKKAAEDLSDFEPYPALNFDTDSEEETPGKEKLSIEEAFEKLDAMLQQMESDDFSLEDSFKNYREGMELLKYCNDSIDEVEQKVLALNEDGGLDAFEF